MTQNNFLFLVCHEWSGIYKSCQNLINKHNIADIMLFDIEFFLKRKHLLNKIKTDFSKWKKSLKNKNNLIVSELLARVLLNKDSIKNIIICGLLSPLDIESIVLGLNITKYKVILVDTPYELLYSNFQTETNSDIDYQQFVKQNNEILSKIKDTLNTSSVNASNFFNTYNNNSNLHKEIADYFGYKIQLTYKNQQPYMWPISPKYIITKQDNYGVRPKHMILGTAKFHSGFDITAETNTPVKASTDGTVVFAGLDERIFSGESKWNQRYGKMVEIVDNYGRRQIYAHLRKIFVKEGDFVSQGKTIALSGCSGGARVPHLHFEIRKTNLKNSGQLNTVDPLTLLPPLCNEKLTEHFKQKPYCVVWEKMISNPFETTDNDIPYSNNKKYIR